MSSAAWSANDSTMPSSVAGTRTRAKTAGTTLVESIVSIFMVTMGILTFGSLAVFSKKISVESQCRQIATSFASKQLDELSATTYTLLHPGDHFSVLVPTQVQQTLPVVENASYAMKAEYFVLPTATPTVRQLVVHVWWSNKAASGGADAVPTSQVQVSRLIAQQPPDPTLSP